MVHQSTFRKAFLFFLIVLFHSALTISNSVAVGIQAIQETKLTASSQTAVSPPEIHIGFDGIVNAKKSTAERSLRFGAGLVKQSLSIGVEGVPTSVNIATDEQLKLSGENDFSIEFWVRTTADSDRRFVVLSKKNLSDNTLKSHKQKGWAFCVCDGTWAWNIGSGNRRLTYERDNGQFMAINDGRWHQLAMTYEHSRAIVRLYFDGVNWVTYNLMDKDGFEFSNDIPLTVGWTETSSESQSTLPEIKRGADQLQNLVDAFNRLDLGDLKPNELMDLVINSERLIENRMLNKSNEQKEKPAENDLKNIKRLVRNLSGNPFTVHQVADFMQVAPLLKLYRLNAGKIEIDDRVAAKFGRQQRFSCPDFEIDELSGWNRTLTQQEIRKRYGQHFQVAEEPLKQKLSTLTAAAFNIHHGGKHETIEEDGWDSREVIADLIRRENVDVVMMQETYSSGDFIAAELGYYFATTVDWDYLNQGSNISVLSRYPIELIHVPPKSSFMNVAAKVSISESQSIYVMSNWYGMNNFNDVFDFHEKRIGQSDNIPILFAGDFNAVPHTDGGNSPASKKLRNAGFHDAFREQHPDVKKHPGYSHQSGSRIDQLYYKGQGLSPQSTEVFSKWPSKFPSDHFLIKSVFKLNYMTKPN